MLIKLKLQEFKGEAAILKSESGETAVWPKSKLPENIQIGSVLVFNIFGDSVKSGSNREIAKEILNEILNTD